MKNNVINTSNIKLAQIRYFNEKVNACEIPTIEAYALLVNVWGKYINLFNFTDELPVYTRAPYSNTTMDGEDYGTKIVLVTGEVQEGPCYVLEPLRMKSVFRKEKISFGELEQYVLQSDLFFVDRIGLLEDANQKGIQKMKNNKKILEDSKKMAKLNEYFLSQGKGITYQK